MDLTALRLHAKPHHTAKKPRGRPHKEDAMLAERKPERRKDYRLLYEAIKLVRDNYVLHNHELYNHLTGILAIVVRPVDFEKALLR